MTQAAASFEYLASPGIALAGDAYGYDGVTDSKRRKSASSILRSEDNELAEFGRQKMTATTRDLRRNFALAAFIIRKHLDFVAKFSFDANTGDAKLDKTIEAFIESVSKRDRFDRAGRHDRRRALRLFEAARTLDGDVGVMKLASGHIQAIEGDRIRSGMSIPRGIDRKSLTNGVKTDTAGKAMAYALHNRDGSSFRFARMIPAENLYLHGYYDRFDQVRGVSPLAPAINTLRDTYEGIDYALAKAKIAQIFAFAMYREGSQGISGGIDFSAGPQVLDLSATDKAEFLTDKTPSDQFREFMQLTIMLTMKALDIPYSFFDESHTNFFGSRSALLLYQKSAESKRDDNRDLLDDWALWRMRLGVLDGELVLPAGVTVDQIAYRWIPDGLPWWDQAKEVRGDAAAVALGVRTRTEIRAERYGDDWTDVIDKLAEEEAYIEKAGVHITYADPIMFAPDAPQPEGGDNAEDR